MHNQVLNRLNANPNPNAILLTLIVNSKPRIDYSFVDCLSLSINSCKHQILVNMFSQTLLNEFLLNCFFFFFYYFFFFYFFFFFFFFFLFFFFFFLFFLFVVCFVFFLVYVV